MLGHTIVVIGGGIVGVFAALRARKLKPTSRIVLVEQDNELGGLLRSDMHPNGLNFDRGAHTLSQTGISTIDNLLFNDLCEIDWRRFGGTDRDLAGIINNNILQDNSPYLHASKSLIDQVLIDRRVKNNIPSVSPENLYMRLVDLYGHEVTNSVFRTPIKNLFRAELEELNAFVAKQLPLSRIITDNMETWLSRQGDVTYRSIVACPEQRYLPSAYTSPLLTLYPRRMGIGKLFTHLAVKLATADIELWLSAQISDCRHSPDKIEAIQITSAERQETIDGSLNLVWAASPFQLLKLLDLPQPKSMLKPSWNNIMIDFCARLTRPMNCYYYVDYDHNDSFRLTNYSALCEEAAERHFSPFTYEFWCRGGEISETEARQFIVDRFTILGLIESESAVKDVRLRYLAQGAQLPSITNMRALDDVAARVASSAPSNVLNIGLLSRSDLLFTSDLLRNTENRLTELWG